MVAARNDTLIFISPIDGNECCVIENALEEPIKRVAFSPLGDQVLVMGKNLKYIKLYKSPM